MRIVTFVLFIIYIYSFGYSLTRFIKNLSFETIILRLGVGLASFPVLGIILDLLRIPLDWKIFLGISLLYPLYAFIKNGINWPVSFSLPPIKSKYLILFAVLVFCLIIYCVGPFFYPWLEDDDSWRHAASIKYISIEKTIKVESGIFQYINPYPPGYDLIFAILHQTSPSLNWTLKFFNGFIIWLSYLFFFNFAKLITQNDNKAIIAIFFLSAMPCYLSHFIWAHSLVVTLFFPAFYCFMKIEKNKKFVFPTAITIAGIFVTQPTQSIKFCIMLFILFVVRCLIQRRVVFHQILSVLLAGMISFAWWGPVLHQFKAGALKVSSAETVNNLDNSERVTSITKGIFDRRSGTATKVYHLVDYVFVEERNYVNNPVGLGPVVSLLGFLGLFYIFRYLWKSSSIDKMYSLTILLWFIFTFLGLNTMTFNLPIGLFAFRFWMLLAIPASFLATETIYRFISILKLRRTKICMILLTMLATINSTTAFKYRLNMGVWPWGIDWKNKDEMLSYVALRKNLKVNTKVFSFIKNFLVIGNDMHVDYWTADYQNTFKDAFYLDLDDFYNRLKKHNFEYIIVGQREIYKYGAEAFNEKYLALVDSPLFELVDDQGNGARIFKIL